MVKEVFEKAKKPRVDYTVPKADMHVHISLGLSDEGFKRRFQAGRTQLPLDFIAKRKKRYYQNLTEFQISQRRRNIRRNFKFIPRRRTIRGTNGSRIPSDRVRTS